jgi:hypothetical protein
VCECKVSEWKSKVCRQGINLEKAKCVYKVSEWKSTVCVQGVNVEKAKF